METQRGSKKDAVDKLLRKKQAAERLAISTRTLDRMVHQGLIVKVYVGNAPRFRESEIDSIVENGI